MRIHKHIKITAVLLAVLLAVSMLPMSVTLAADSPAKLTIIHVNDRHGRTDADPYISQMAKDLKAKGENVLILDAGDSLHGQTTTNLSKGGAMVEIMNDVGYSAMTPGNHDFNFGVARLQELSELMDFPLLAANVRIGDGQLLFQPYEVFRMNGLTVGVFGIVTPETLTKADPRIVAGLTFEDPAAISADMVQTLQSEGCDIIIALTHMGDDAASDPKNKSDVLAETVPGIDVIIDGHSHTELPNGKMVGNTLIAQTGAFTDNIGIVEISAEKTAVLLPSPWDGTEPDQAVTDKIDALEAANADITSVVVGNTPVLLQGEREYVRREETNLANVITDSMKWATGADIAFLTGGNIRAGIPAGDITMGQVLTTLPFSNLLVTIELSGADVLAMLEHGVAKYPELSGEFIHVAGLTCAFDPDAKAGERVKTAIMANGKAIDTQKTYTVATSEFLAAGGDGYTMLSRGTNLVYFGGDADALADYLQTQPVIKSEPEGRVSTIAAKPTTSKGKGTYIGSVKVTLKSTTPGAAIYYTTDGKTPNEQSKSVKNGGTVTINGTATLKFMAVKQGYRNSAVGSVKYTIQTAKPDTKAVPASQKVKKGAKITLKAPKGVTLYYTINGYDPTGKSKKVDSGKSVKITINKSITLKVKAQKTGCKTSTAVTRKYTLK